MHFFNFWVAFLTSWVKTFEKISIPDIIRNAKRCNRAAAKNSLKREPFFYYFTATVSISIKTPSGNSFTAKAARAGGSFS